MMIIPGLVDAQDSLSRREIRKEEANFLQEERPWTVEVPLWIPGYAGSFAYGDVNVEGEDGIDPSNPVEPPGGTIGEILSRVFTTEWYLKFFFLTKIAYENNRFIGQGDAMAGSVGERIKFTYNGQEIVQATYGNISIRLYGGYELVDILATGKKFRYELFGYLGMRIHLNSIYAERGNSDVLLDIKPSWVVPVIGLQNQFTWKRWFIVIQGDYGGYFVSSKSSSQLSGYVYYKIGKLSSVKLGWNHLTLNHRGIFLDEDYHVRASFSGPAVGIAFQF